MVHTRISFRVSNSPMRRLTMLFLCFFISLFANLLVACGSPSSLPTTYTTTDQTHLAVISWQQNSQDITGTWITWSTDTPVPLKTGFSGQAQENNSIMLTVGGSVLQGNYSGSHLTLNGTTNEGQFQNSTWTPLSQSQANQLSNAFIAYASVRVALGQVQQTIAHAPSDSDPYAYAMIVQSAQAYVTTLQQKDDQILALGNPCGSGDLALFRSQFPPDASLFRLAPSDQANNTAQQNAALAAANSTLGRQIQTTQEAWRQASSAPVPHVSGLSLPWLLSSKDEALTTQTGQKTLSVLQVDLTNDYQAMAQLKQQSEQVGVQITQLEQSNGC